MMVQLGIPTSILRRLLQTGALRLEQLKVLDQRSKDALHQTLIDSLKPMLRKGEHHDAE